MSLNPCAEPGPIKSVNNDPTPPFCNDEPGCVNQNHTPGDGVDWLDEFSLKKTGFGHSQLCDPIQKGYIINEQQGMGQDPDRSTQHRYSKAMRGCDEAMLDMFSDIIVLDDAGKSHQVPIIHGTQEKAVLAIMSPNYRKDNSLVVDRITLPILAIHASDVQQDLSRYTYHKAQNFLKNRDGKPGFAIKEKYDRDTVFGLARGIPINISYTLYAWTLYREDMNQIIEQIMKKITPMGYIKVKGVSWEVVVKLESIGNQIEIDPGDRAVNVFKYQFIMKVETYIPQPLTRYKSVLKTKIDLVNGIEEQDIDQIIMQLEEAVKEFQ